MKPNVITRLFLALTLSLGAFGASAQILSFYEVHKDDASGGSADGMESAYGVAVSPDDNHIYVASSNDDAVALFSKNGGNSGATFCCAYKNSDPGINFMNGAKRLAVAPDGNHIYIPTSTSNSVVVFSRNPTNGQLTYVEAQVDGVSGIDGIGGAYNCVVSPDNNHVYVAASTDDAITTFSRNTTTGALTYVETLWDTTTTPIPITTLNSVRGLAISPDGNYVYIASSLDDAVTIFQRDSGTGKLTWKDREKDGFGGVDGLNGAYGVAISPDGLSCYVAGSSDDAVAVFSRDTSSGLLTYVEVHKDDSQGGSVSYLNAARSVYVGATGAYVYAASSTDDGLVVFTRNAGTSALTLSEEYTDGVGGVDGLDGARMLVSPSDETIAYIVSNTDDALVIFENDVLLPIELVEFEADAIGSESVELRWSTASELNNDYFEIQRSTDGEHFLPIAEVDGSGTTADRTDYLAFDDQPALLNYYRLRQVDFDGKYSYSNIVAVNIKRDNSPVRTMDVYPNPANDADRVYLRFQGVKQQEVSVTVQDVFGQQILSKVILTDVVGGESIIAIDPTDKLSPGTYIITGSIDDQLFSKKLVVK